MRLLNVRAANAMATPKVIVTILLDVFCPKIVRSDKVKCVLCSGNHSANYKGCTVYKQLQEKAFPRPRQRIIREQVPLEQPQNAGFSYADAVRGPKQPNPETCDFTDLKNMMKTFMEQMSAMMNLLSTVVSKLVNGSN